MTSNPTTEELDAALNGDDAADFCVAASWLAAEVESAKYRLREATERRREARVRHLERERQLSDAEARLAAAMERVVLNTAYVRPGK